MLHKDLILELPSTLSSVAELEGFVTDLMERYGLARDVEGNLLTSLTEAVTNAIRHGNQFDANKSVRIEVFYGRDQLKVVVIDQGSGFEPEAVPDPTADVALEKEGGRGVFLMKLLTDKIRFEDEGRAVEMYYRCRCANVRRGSSSGWRATVNA
jgi:serine/threonine-protein kinase RsbW